jgi:hypothetical protein
LSTIYVSYVSLFISAVALGLAAFSVLRPNIEWWPESIRYPGGRVKTFEIQFGVRNRRKHSVHVIGAVLSFRNVRLTGARPLSEGPPIVGFTLNANGDLEIAVRQEIELGKLAAFHLEVDVDDGKDQSPAQVIVSHMAGESGPKAPSLRVTLREFSPRRQTYVVSA